MTLSSSGVVPSSPTYVYFARNPAAPGHLFIGIDLKGDVALTENDFVYVVFDANNNDTWDTGDFYIAVQVGRPGTPVSSGTACSVQTGPSSTGAAQYFSWDTANSKWQAAPAAVSQQVLSTAAYDYDSGGADTESQIWNVEISIPLNFMSGGTNYFPLQTAAAPYFGVGAYVFAPDAAQVPGINSFVARWPDTMVDRAIGDKNLNGPHPSHAVELANASLSDKCFDVTFVGVSNPWLVNGSNASAFDRRVNRTGLNKFQARFLFEGPPGAVGTLSNKGTVTLDLIPYNASGAGTAWTKQQTVTPNAINQEFVTPGDAADSLNYNFPGNFPSNFGASSDFVCGQVQLSGFQFDDDTSPSSNQHHANYNYFTTSTYTQTVALYGNGIPGAKAGEKSNLYLHFESRNEPTPAASPLLSPSPVSRFRAPILRLAPWAAAILAALVIALRARERRRWALGTLAGAGIVVTLIGCPPGPVYPPPGQGSVPSGGGGRWQVTNAGQLGLEPVPNQPDWYRMPIGKDETKQMQIDFRGMPLPYKPVHYQLKPGGPEGTPATLRLPVKPGRAISVLAFGMIDLDGDGPLAATSATGTALSAALTSPVSAVAGNDRSLAAASPRYLLAAGRYRPADFAGALIGSFDGFKTSFVVGTDASFLVPPNNDVLQLAVNALSGQYARITGLYNIVIIDTPAPAVPTHTAIRGSATYNVPPYFNLWEILTSMNVYTYYEKPVGPGDPALRAPLNEAHMIVYESHE